MTREDHHLLCIGVLAEIGRRAFLDEAEGSGFVLDGDDLRAIEQAIEAAEALGMPVSADNWRAGRPVCTRGRN